MKPTNQFYFDFLDMNPQIGINELLWRAVSPVSVQEVKGVILVKIPFQAQKPGIEITADPSIPRKVSTMQVRAYGQNILRLTLVLDGVQPADEQNPMLEWDPGLVQEPLTAQKTSSGWNLVDRNSLVRMQINTSPPTTQFWSNQISPPDETFNATVYPDGHTKVPFMAYDTFFPKHHDSFSLAYIEKDDQPDRITFSLHADADEKFAGTGERFAPINLAGRTLLLENQDSLGVNNRVCYKNIPFYLSSRPYGLLILNSAHIRLSLADLSTRAAQALVEDNYIDLFFIGGGSPERILYHYRQLTGFPRQVPLWSYGIWMSRMTYFNAQEAQTVAQRLRSEEFPCDVIHLDTGWFKHDWACDWKFNLETFPDPEGYLAGMRSQGFRTSLWQLPAISAETDLFAEASANRYVPPKFSQPETAEKAGAASNFSTPADGETHPGYAKDIDFSNPQATAWYQGLLRNLLKMGVSAIKTDFGEVIDMEADYLNIPAYRLHNLYALLYQRAAYEVTRDATGEGIIWARSSWTGSQRYPIHWGGDAACSWDGLAGSIRGGLHLGASGFAFWSHDVPGFHGVPDFMNSLPPDDLYIRWTQAGVFTSHLRYHGAQKREPYEYPAIANLIRKWWRFRYAIIPYLFDAGSQAIQSGFPVLSALILRHPDDPTCWLVDDEFYCGFNLLVAPVMNSENTRNIYLPEGKWRDLWTGELLVGPRWLYKVTSPLEQIPVFAVDGGTIRIYPESVSCTDEMDMNKAVELVMDGTYAGLSKSILGKVTGMDLS